MGHEIIETIADPTADYMGWVLKEPYSWDTGNFEFCDWCNRPNAQNKSGGSGLTDPNAAGVATYSNGGYGNCYWDEANGGCRAEGSIDGNRKRSPLRVARYLGVGFLANAQLIWIFWGEEWKSQTTPSRTDILRNYQLLDQTTYHQPLSQYNINKPNYFMDIIYDDPFYTPPNPVFLFPRSLDPKGNPNDEHNVWTVLERCWREGKIPTQLYKGDGSVTQFVYLVMVPQGIMGLPGAGAHTAFQSNIPNVWQPPGGGGGGGYKPPLALPIAAVGSTTLATVASYTDVMCNVSQGKSIVAWMGDYANSATAADSITDPNSWFASFTKNNNCIGRQEVPNNPVLGEQEGNHYCQWAFSFAPGAPNRRDTTIPICTNPTSGWASSAKDWNWLNEVWSTDNINTNNILFLNVNSNAYDFAYVKSELEKWMTTEAESTNFSWKVCLIHHPIYGSPTAADPTPDTKNIRSTLVSLLEEKGFDLVIQGHQRNYQRSYPLVYGSGGNTPTITDNTSTKEFYNITNGIVYFTVGSGGQTLQTFTSQAPYIAVQNAADFGIFQLQITGRTITGGEIWTRMNQTWFLIFTTISKMIKLQR
jgi:hypothetical protein